ncbi:MULTISPECIES: PTS sugar transporter subunit IIB [Streptococcus]|uniref:PTS sugar transporter subunit IIB n=1 Tax=Streptococcus TaxID=1301 RepID=UPI0008071993|nr:MULTISPECIES: PTS sugar transporter subunit IIB [Streptococcus]OBZ00926.1 PTS maltose transporter subunit IIBC [Streptococcus dysgalactiae subsp. equisimilis]PXX83691.1 PTS maltose transporter subunit IIBC [Streptococcus dysgalactiae subsp. equisimilis]VGW72337.1 PTS system transporter subunit IIB [Streptococcus pyogenes]VGW86102.1 PTS system transporter subunit IIB [Streptococcus pyogenes]VGX90271.1 PTS system transporter subunit IIB [Streptococcus pyogenes]
MIKIVTVCGNGIGSSLLLRMKVEAIASSLGIDVDAESCDSNAAVGKGADLFVTVKEFKDIFPEDAKVCIVKSYTNRKKIEEDLVPILKEMSGKE